MSCTKSSLKKYISRPSPPFPANLCPKGDIKMGNDKTPYIAKPDKNGVNHWVPYGSRKTAKKSGKSRSTKSKTKSKSRSKSK